MKPYKGAYYGSVIISIAAVLCGIHAYAAAGRLIGSLFAGETGGMMIILCVSLIAVFKIVSALLSNVSTLISHHAAYNTLADIRKALSSKLLRLPPGYFEENGSGRLKTVIVDRIEDIENTAAS